MSLINGMDDIMTYIKNQDILVKKLTEENKKLKKDAEGLYDHEGAIACLDLVDGEEHRLLQEEVNDRVVIEDIAHAFGSEEGEDFDWESEIHELKEENKKLKSEMADAEIRGAGAEKTHWQDEILKAFKSFEEHDAEDVTREDIDPEFVGAWIHDALKRDQQHYDMKEEREKAIGEILTVLLKVK